MRKGITLLRPLAGLSFLMLAVVAQADVFRWVDANGRVHFSDKAPAHQKVETLTLPEADATVAAPDISEEERKQRQQRLVQALEEERLAKAQHKAELKQKEVEHQAHCERFRNRMQRLQSSTHVYSENKDGTVTYWKDAEADRYKADMNSRLQQECGAD